MRKAKIIARVCFHSASGWWEGWQSAERNAGLHFAKRVGVAEVRRGQGGCGRARCVCSHGGKREPCRVSTQKIEVVKMTLCWNQDHKPQCFRTSGNQTVFGNFYDESTFTPTPTSSEHPTTPPTTELTSLPTLSHNPRGVLTAVKRT
jgi:hypothetical protein